MKEILNNKKINFNYEIIDSFEAGIVLEGNEVKSIRDKKISIQESYVSIVNGEAILKQCHIPRYESANTFKIIDETRERKLLLHKKQILKLQKAVEQEGLTIVPRSVYTKSGKIKIEIVLAKGKKNYDKRESIKEREQKIDIQRNIKEGY